jgi:RNA polymerase sigma-70 factor (ECF subfamily)
MVQRDLVLRAQQGDHDAFALLAGAALTRLDTSARLVLRDPDLAKDVVQNTLVRAWRDLRQLRDPDRWEAWLHKLLVRSCYDELRRLRRRPLEVAIASIDLPAVLDEAAASMRRADIERGFLALDPDQRLVVVLHYYLDLPLPEVATAAGIPVGTSKSRLHRGLVALRSALGPAAPASAADGEVAG